MSKGKETKGKDKEVTVLVGDDICKVVYTERKDKTIVVKEIKTK